MSSVVGFPVRSLLGKALALAQPMLPNRSTSSRYCPNGWRTLSER